MVVEGWWWLLWVELLGLVVRELVLVRMARCDLLSGRMGLRSRASGMLRGVVVVDVEIWVVINFGWTTSRLCSQFGTFRSMAEFLAQGTQACCRGPARELKRTVLRPQ
jgi:hypothetical protein